MIRLTKYSFLLLCGLLFVACSKNNTEGGVKLSKKKDAELVQALGTMSNLEYSSFYSKISTSYSDTAQNISFKTTLRVRADSATIMTISYARIPIVNALITADSVKVSNKKDKCYTKESINFIKEKFGVDFSLKNVEELMMGLPLDFDPEREYFQMDSDKGYMLSSHGKKDLKKMKNGELKEVVMFYTLSPELDQLISMTVLSPENNTEIRVDYKTRELIDSTLFPKLVEIRIITPLQEISIDMEYKKTRVNKVEQIHFVIPESYEKCP